MVNKQLMTGKQAP